MNEVEPFDTSKLFKDFRGLWVLNKKYCRTEKRNIEYFKQWLESEVRE